MEIFVGIFLGILAIAFLYAVYRFDEPRRTAMRLMRTMFWLLIVFTPLALVSTARADYLPDEAFLAKMEKMLSMASQQTIWDFYFKEVKAGQIYREGDVAYFAVVAASPGALVGNSFMQLEEYRRRADGSWLVTFTKMWPFQAIRWTMRIDAEQRNPAFSWEEKLDIASPEAIAASERAQQLLRDHGRPVMIGGVAI